MSQHPATPRRALTIHGPLTPGARVRLDPDDLSSGRVRVQHLGSATASMPTGELGADLHGQPTVDLTEVHLGALTSPTDGRDVVQRVVIDDGGRLLVVDVWVVESGTEPQTSRRAPEPRPPTRPYVVPVTPPPSAWLPDGAPVAPAPTSPSAA